MIFSDFTNLKKWAANIASFQNLKNWFASIFVELLIHPDYHKISSLLHQWYLQHCRDLPWRKTKDPYKIWLSEIILQQTQVAQGTPYYLRFIEMYPDVSDLAKAKEDDVLKLWQGLGYYSRARNLLKAANQVMNEFDGDFPKSYNDLIRLKGIGKYTASAIASIAFEEPKAVVDGNVVRVICRLFGIQDNVLNAKVQHQIEDIADVLLKNHKPSIHNQAMMEFGAILCKPKNPKCTECVLSSICVALKENLIAQIPRKDKKLKRTRRYLHFLIISDGQHTLLHRRNTNDIWAGLYQFPLIEREASSTLKDQDFMEFGLEKFQLLKIKASKKHVLSHQDLYAKFYHIYSKEFRFPDFLKVKNSEVHNFALPRLIDRYLESHDI